LNTEPMATKPLQDKKIVLPGGAGLVGQNLVARLAALGARNVVVIDKHAHNLGVLRRMHPWLTVIEADLSRPGPWCDHFADADAVVMLQAQIGGIDYADFERNNLTSTGIVLDQLRQRPAQLVHISSSVVNSVADDFYTRSKIAQEAQVVASGVPVTILRPTLMFGWFDRKHLGWLSRFMKKVPVFPVPGHGRYMRQPLYVGDFCDIILSCLTTGGPQGNFNISGQERIDYIDIIRAIRRANRLNTPIVKIPYRLFHLLLATWALFDRNPPFTTQQLAALVAPDDFEVIDWPSLFGVKATPLDQAFAQTFNDPTYSQIALEF
jgi:nucleoside-diphosphate-sugar epimerase